MGLEEENEELSQSKPCRGTEMCFEREGQNRNEIEREREREREERERERELEDVD